MKILLIVLLMFSLIAQADNTVNVPDKPAPKLSTTEKTVIIDGRVIKIYGSFLYYE